MPFSCHRPLTWIVAAVLATCLHPLSGAESADVVTHANVLASQGDRAGAIAVLQERLRVNPDDQLARQTLLGLRVAEQEAEIRKLLAEQAKTSPGKLGDPDYEEARKRTTEAIRRRLDVAEYSVRQHRYAEAMGAINAILHDYPNDPAAMTLKLQVLNALTDDERASLLKEKAAARENAINDILDSMVMPGELPKSKRTVLVFDEDVDEAERAALKAKLQVRLDLIYDGQTKFKKADGTEETTKPASVRELLQTLFAISGVNYVLLDSSLGTETLTLHLVQETVDNALNTIAKLVKVRFNYSGGTVFVSSADSELLVTEIIHLQAGLTDVQAEAKMGDFGGGDAGGGGGGGGAGAGGGNNGLTQIDTTGGANKKAAAPGGKGGGGGDGKAASDLERLLEKAPDLIVGWPSGAKIFVERKSNTVIVQATPAAISELRRLIKTLDYNNVQVLIEARFVEVQDTAAMSLGVDWSAAAASASGTLSGASDGVVPPAFPVPPVQSAITPATAGGSGLFAQVLATPASNFGIKAQISALEQKGLADTLQEPKILTLNNAQGLIEIKQDIAYISSYESPGYSSGYVGTTTGNNNNGFYNGGGLSSPTLVPKYTKDYAGVRLEFRPSVARNSNIITLQVTPVVREMVTPPKDQTFTNQAPGTGSQPVTNIVQSPPLFDTRSLSTILHVKNGGTVALGGLSRERETKDRSGVPVMSRIPFLGALFRKDATSSDRRNLLIFVTANIIDPTGAKQGDEIEKLRDTARIIMPDDVTKAEENTKAKQDKDDKDAEKKSADDDQPAIWRRERRR